GVGGEDGGRTEEAWDGRCTGHGKRLSRLRWLPRRPTGRARGQRRWLWRAWGSGCRSRTRWAPCFVGLPSPTEAARGPDPRALILDPLLRRLPYRPAGRYPRFSATAAPLERHFPAVAH